MIYQYFAQKGGWRFVVLFHEGRKWLKALDTATLEIYRLKTAERGHLVPYRMPPRVLAGRIRKRSAFLRSCDLRFSEAAVKAALARLTTKAEASR